MHELCYEQGEQRFEEDLRRARASLEDVIDAPILGYRAPGFSILDDMPWAFEVIHRVGFLYDSSIFPAPRQHGGAPGASPYPHQILLENGEALVEFPMTISEWGLRRMAFSGGGYLRLYPYPWVRRGLRRVNARNHPACVYLHPREIDPDHPRVQMSPGRRFRCYVNLRSTEPKLERLVRDFRFAPLVEVLRKHALLPELRDSAAESAVPYQLRDTGKASIPALHPVSRVSQKQILFLSHYFPPEVNAPASRTYEHCKRWVAAGHRVTVVTCFPNCPDGVVFPGYRNAFRKVETVDGIRVIRVWTYVAPNAGFVRRTANYLSYMASALLQALVERDVDVIVASSPQLFCGWAGALFHWIRRKPFVLEIRDIWPESILVVGAMKKSLAVSFLESIENWMYHSANFIVAVGDGYRRKIIDKGISPEKVAVVINGVDPEKFAEIPDTTSIRKKLGSEGKFVCSYVGTVGLAHGLEVVLEAAQICRERDIDDVIFWIVGSGARREELQEEAQDRGLDNVKFTGRLPKEQMPEVIAASDANLVHLRGTELFGTVIPSKIFECMAMETPIIMGVVGEAQDMVIRGNAGVPMRPDDPESLLECIREIRERGPDAFRARQYALENFHRDQLARQMLELVVQVAG
jgi:polysaccharide deacetylase family protein (PEP-CTERM system associated)